MTEKRPKMQHCHYCGVELGCYNTWPGDIESCGEPECLRSQRDSYAEREEVAREAAEADGYSLYGGGW